MIVTLIGLGFPMYGQQKFKEKLIDRLTVYFETNSYTIHDTDKVIIKEFVDDLEVVMPYMFKIQSHTDSIGSSKFNDRLSEKRSEAIKKLLLELGVPELMISTKGIGEIKPVMDNETEEGRAKNRRGNIFVFEISKQRLFKSQVQLENRSKVNAMVYIQDDEQVDSVATDEYGNFAFIVPENKDITFGVFAQGYMFTTRKINTAKDLPVADIYLKKIQKNAKVSLQNLYFVGDQAILLPESKPELVNMLRFLKQNKNLKLEIGGHVNGPLSNQGDPNWYYNLAYDRTLAVKKYITDNLLNPANYICKSYSNTQMIFPEPINEEEAKHNRRVELKVIE